MKNVASFESFNIYPNPSSDQLLLDVQISNSTELMSNIVDNNGHVVLSRSNKLNSGKQTLQYNIQNLPAGSYHLLLIDENNNSSVHEFIKK